MNASMNSGLITVMLMEFIAAMPCSGGSRPSAAITKVENAKKMPATRPLLTAATKVKMNIARSSMMASHKAGHRHAATAGLASSSDHRRLLRPVGRCHVGLA